MRKNKDNVAVMCFSGGCGGMENDAIKLAKLLRSEYAVTLYCKKGSYIHEKLNSQTRINYVPIRFLSRKFSLSMLFSVRKEVKKNSLFRKIRG